jgi:Flp pilus assembly protein TadG
MRVAQQLTPHCRQIARNSRCGHKGQATVEFALIFPLAIAFTVFVLLAGAVIYDQLTLSEIARLSARTAIVSDDPAEAARHIASQLDPSVHIRTTVDNDTGLVTVRLQRTRQLPILFFQRVLPDVEIRASVTMMREPPLQIGG